jgi:hypothetical protein
MLHLRTNDFKAIKIDSIEGMQEGLLHHDKVVVNMRALLSRNSCTFTKKHEWLHMARLINLQKHTSEKEDASRMLFYRTCV